MTFYGLTATHLEDFQIVQDLTQQVVGDAHLRDPEEYSNMVSRFNTEISNQILKTKTCKRQSRNE
jgi:hypothetical protein